MKRQEKIELPNNIDPAVFGLAKTYTYENGQKYLKLLRKIDLLQTKRDRLYQEIDKFTKNINTMIVETEELEKIIFLPRQHRNEISIQIVTNRSNK